MKQIISMPFHEIPDYEEFYSLKVGKKLYKIHDRNRTFNAAEMTDIVYCEEGCIIGWTIVNTYYLGAYGPCGYYVK